MIELDVASITESYWRRRLTNRIYVCSLPIFRQMATTRNTCTLDDCKRAVVCLCRHCQQDVCLKHFNEHQSEVNNELLRVTDSLNERMKFYFDF